MCVCDRQAPMERPASFVFVRESSCLEMSFQPPDVSDVIAIFPMSTGLQSHVALDEPSASMVSHTHVGCVFVVLF